MTEPLGILLTRLSEADGRAVLWGRQAKPYFGPAFQRLLSRGVLVENAPDTTWPVCADCECGRDDRPIAKIGDRYVAICPVDRRADRVLEQDDLRSFTIERAALVRELAGSANLSGEPSEITAGIWLLEGRSSSRTLFLAFSEAALARDGVLARIRNVARGAKSVVLTPSLSAIEAMRLSEMGMHLVPFDQAIRSGADQSFLLDLSALKPRVAEPRLRIERAARRVFLDGRLVRTSPQQFSLLCLLAERALENGAPVATREIEDHLWGSGVHRLTTQPKEPIRSLRKALGDSDLIESTSNPNGYRLVLEPTTIQLVP